MAEKCNLPVSREDGPFLPVGSDSEAARARGPAFVFPSVSLGCLLCAQLLEQGIPSSRHQPRACESPTLPSIKPSNGFHGF